VKPHAPATTNQFNLLLHPQLTGLFGAILQVLSPYPDARAAVAAALREPPAALPSPMA
jgi:hypothetical protein